MTCFNKLCICMCMYFQAHQYKLKCCQDMRRVRCKITYGKSNINLLIKGNAEIIFTFFYSRRSYRLLCKTFFYTRSTTYFLGNNFLFFLPDCSTQHKGSLECLSVSLSVSLGDAMSSDYLLSRSIDDVRDTSVFLLVRSLLSPILKREGLQRHNKCLWYS